MPFFSIIIPAYNAEKYIEATVDSVLNQEYRNFEVIIINDGSTDKTQKIIEDYEQNYDNIFGFSKKNEGVSEARNFGISKSQGKYIAFLDSDDLWDKDFLQKNYEKISQTNSDCVVSTVKLMNSDGIIYHEESVRRTSNDMLLSFLYGDYWAATGTWIVKMSVILKYEIKFSKDVSWAEDLEFFVKCLLYCETEFIYRSMFTYRQRNESLSSFSLNKLNEIFIWKCLKEVIDSSNTSKKNIYVNLIERYRIPMVAIRLGMESYKEKRIKEFFLNSLISKKELIKLINMYSFINVRNKLGFVVYGYKIFLKSYIGIRKGRFFE